MDPLKYKLDFSNRIQAISYVSFLLAQHFLFALIDEHETKKKSRQLAIHHNQHSIFIWDKSQFDKDSGCQKK